MQNVVTVSLRMQKFPSSNRRIPTRFFGWTGSLSEEKSTKRRRMQVQPNRNSFTSNLKELELLFLLPSKLQYLHLDIPFPVRKQNGSPHHDPVDG